MKPLFSIAVGALALGAVAVISANRTGARHAGVAPWDTPDEPNPNPGAPSGSAPVADPAGIVKAGGLSGTTANGFTVTLTGLARKAAQYDTLPDSRPDWDPEGGPRTGRPFGSATLAAGASLEDKGARYLQFKIAGPARRNVDVMGYVPDGAREETPKPELHGWDKANFLSYPTGGGETTYTTCVVVDDRSASRYRFAVADGEWKEVASGPFDPMSKTPATLLSGPWGSLRHLAPQKGSRMVSAWTIGMAYGASVLDPPTLAPREELRAKFLDKAGRETQAFWYRGSTGGPAVKVVVESRPWHWVELSGIHYDPDPKKWKKAAYWGDEGDKTIARAGGTRLVGLIRPRTTDPGQWEPAEVYAPDGKLWRGHPEPSAIQPRFSGGTLGSDALVAAFHLDATKVSRDTPAKIQGFASDSATPGKDLREPLGPWKAGSSDYELTQVMFNRPTRPYVQFAVSYASANWTPAGEIPVPQEKFPLVDPKDKPKYDAGSFYNTTFSVALRSYGQADVYGNSRDGKNFMRQGLVKWPTENEVRVVARLKSGERIVLETNSSGGGGTGAQAYSTRDVGFDLTSNSDAQYVGTHPGEFGSYKVLLSAIAAFEIETRKPTEPVYLVAKLPTP